MLADGRPISVDVFGIAAEPGGAFLRDAAVAAGHDLGVFEALRGAGPCTLDELASALGIVAGRHRLRALLDVLAALGAITRDPPRFAAAGEPPRPVVAPAGWGALADVIRRDRPLPVAGDDRAASERRLHHHLATAGAAAAAELVAQLDVTSMLDLGAGAGAYSRAFLAAHPAGRATLVDTAEILALAEAWLGPLASRARFVAGDATELAVGHDHGAVLLANVLHLHPPAVCARLCVAAARAAAPGGLVVVKDLRVDDDRAGPLEGLLFALNMAIYTPAGDVYSTHQLRTWLADAGLTELRELRLAAAPDAIVVLGRRPRGEPDGPGLEGAAGHVAPGSPAGAAGPVELDGDAPAGEGADHEAPELPELDDTLARSAIAAWRALGERGELRAEAAAGPPVLGFPAALRRFLAAAVAFERAAGAGGRADDLVRHYADVMPRLRVAQLAGTDEPGATLFHAPLDWAQLPRLTAALDRLFELVVDSGVAPEAALGARSADALRAASPTLAALYARTHYGGFMPLLYGSPADLAYFHARGVAGGGELATTIDRYLTAPLVHELCHFAPERRAVAAPHLDECIAGWLGVHVHPELAYPTDDHDDALFAAPWLAQVGQAIARAFGIAPLVRAHAGGELSALPAAFVAGAARLGWDDWRARRTLHFLSDTFDPAPWVALALACGAGRSVADATVASLARLPLAGLALPADPGFDRAIVEDALRAMCLATTQVAGSFRTRARLPSDPIAIDAVGCAVVAARPGALEPVAPRYWLPPAVAGAITAARLAGYELRLGALAAIPEAAAAIAAGSPGCERAGFALVPVAP